MGHGLPVGEDGTRGTQKGLIRGVLEYMSFQVSKLQLCLMYFRFTTFYECTYPEDNSWCGGNSSTLW